MATPSLSAEDLERFRALAAMMGFTLQLLETAPAYALPEPNVTSSPTEAPKAAAPSTDDTQLSGRPALAQNPTPAPAPPQAQPNTALQPPAPPQVQAQATTRCRPNMRPVPSDALLPPAGASLPNAAAPPPADAPNVAAPPPAAGPIVATLSPAAAPSPVAHPPHISPLVAPLIANPSLNGSCLATPALESRLSATAKRRKPRTIKAPRLFRLYTQPLTQAEHGLVLAELKAIQAATPGKLELNYVPTAPPGMAERSGWKARLAGILGVTIQEMEMIWVLVWTTLLRTPGIDMNKLVSQHWPKIVFKKVNNMVLQALPEMQIYELNNYWPLNIVISTIFRSLAGNHKTVIRPDDGGDEGAEADEEVEEAADKQPPKPKGKGKGKGKKAEAEAEAATLEPTIQATLKPTDNSNAPITNLPGRSKGEVVGAHQAVDDANVARENADVMDWAQAGDQSMRIPDKTMAEQVLDLETGMDSIRLTGHVESEGEDMEPMSGNMLPPELATGTRTQVSPLHARTSPLRTQTSPLRAQQSDILGPLKKLGDFSVGHKSAFHDTKLKPNVFLIAAKILSDQRMTLSKM
ncbi:hypothetical protein FRC12_010180 [Ceratobasidium sp. 428]|nr:hypothetical protein FRC12_010180 [Ceratobasidium sp. 428]